jgi:EAL domain-containing protein (putative c-di-GMP-specific phosphodiesterase class I)
MNRKSPRRQPNRLLIVDANPDTRAFAAALAEQAGFLVATAANAREGRERGATLAPTVILLDPQDLGAPDIDLFDWLRREHSHAALILACASPFSVLGSAEEMGLAYGLQVSVALRKPLSADILAAALEPQIIRGHRFGVEDLRRAIDRSQLCVHYQPKVLATHGDTPIAGVEALLRWEHPDYGLVYPDEFIGLAEQHGMISALTDFVLQTGIEQIGEWNRLGLKLDLSVNFSAKLVTDADFPVRLHEFLSRHSVDASQLTLEITEAATFDNPLGNTDMLARLRDTGIGVSLDDFGTGYSSLTQLLAMPVGEVKIDRSLGMEISGNESSRGIVRAIIDLCHNVGLKVCCEGVEDAAALDFLRAVGCDYAQGYYIARPMSARDIARWLSGANDGSRRMAS